MADEMISVCERAGVTLAVYHNYLACSVIADGIIGDVVATEICGLGSRPWLGTERFRPGWRFLPGLAGGGVMMDIGVHAFYLTELLHPEPAQSLIAQLRFIDSGVDDHAYCLAVRVASADRPAMTHYVPPGRTQFTPEIFDDLVDSIMGDRDAFRSYGPDGRRALEIAHAAYQSTVAQRPVRLPIPADSSLYHGGTVPILLRREASANAG
jgi:predicted dehydrogenase